MTENTLASRRLRSRRMTSSSAGRDSSGSVVARRLAENPEVSVLLLEAAATMTSPRDEGRAVAAEPRGRSGIGTSRPPIRHVNGRSIPLSMGKVLGRRIEHQRDGVGARAQERLGLLRRRSRRRGVGLRVGAGHLPAHRGLARCARSRLPRHRGAGVRSAGARPQPLGPRHGRQAAQSVGIPTFENPNGRMMEAAGGASIADVRARDGSSPIRVPLLRFPYLDRPEPDGTDRALVTRLTSTADRATGVEILLTAARCTASGPRGGGAVTGCDQHPQGADAVRHR